MADNYTFEEELYQAISMLEFWDEDKAQLTGGGVLFQVSNISAIEEFVAMGVVSLDLREEEQAVEFLSIDFVLAKNADASKEAIIKQKLYDVNLGLKEGMFYLDDEKNLCFEANFPVIRGDVEGALTLFIAQYIEIMNYLDGVFPFLLRVVSHPEDADFAEYITAMLGEEAEE